MQPLGLVIALLGLLLLIVGIQGSQHKLASALTNKPAAA